MSSHNDSFAASGSSPTWQEQIPSRPDFLLEHHGSIFLLRPQNEQATAWICEHIGSGNGFQAWWPSVVIEHRYIADILEGIRNDGLVIA